MKRGFSRAIGHEVGRVSTRCNFWSTIRLDEMPSFFLPLNLVSFIVSFSPSLQVCTKTIVVSLLRGVSNMWSLLFGLSLAIFYKSLSPHAELEGLMAVLARAVIYIHIDRNKQMAINSGQRQTSVTIILDNLFIQDFVCQLQLLCSIVDTLH